MSVLSNLRISVAINLRDRDAPSLVLIKAFYDVPKEEYQRFANEAAHLEFFDRVDRGRCPYGNTQVKFQAPQSSAASAVSQAVSLGTRFGARIRAKALGRTSARVDRVDRGKAAHGYKRSFSQPYRIPWRMAFENRPRISSNNAASTPAPAQAGRTVEWSEASLPAPAPAQAGRTVEWSEESLPAPAPAPVKETDKDSMMKILAPEIHEAVAAALANALAAASAAAAGTCSGTD
ncbi:uncharacterized protein PAN0_013c4736 [Moesziomyces antarcticus]|uniref:Uncharacterized protein n=2 Tax=Pseudozyma antarctica TaxID=84753 RepID=A0A081CIL8_PSEA2|nr:uncharacterized protein PAN0_013c4736 [Moesziomyces antarcticus]GAK66514.1 hypothetical protein PAN0_013c4736 [Moesziomyces antarcticus]SPO47560.1 uncharacterized protein PSANT_05248 [Moesziomyces antarcticus]